MSDLGIARPLSLFSRVLVAIALLPVAVLFLVATLVVLALRNIRLYFEDAGFSRRQLLQRR